MISTRSKDVTVFGTALLVVIADQLSKAWVRGNLAIGVPWNPIPSLSGIVSCTHVTNVGAAFGMFPQLSWFYAAVSAVVIVVIALSYRKLPARHIVVPLALGMQMGGSAGNLIDRILRGTVTDFIDLNFWPFQSFAVFNLADSAITVGVLVFAAHLLFVADALEEVLPTPCPEDEAR